MLTPEDRDNRLHQVYQNKELLIFLNGKKWFDEMVFDIHYDWEQSGTFLKIDPTSIEISVICWADQHGYLEPAE